MFVDVLKTCKAYELQNQFLNHKIPELNQLYVCVDVLKTIVNH